MIIISAFVTSMAVTSVLKFPQFYQVLLFARSWSPFTSTSHNLFALVFTSTDLSRPNKVGLKCPYVRPSTKRLYDFSEIWRVCRGR